MTTQKSILEKYPDYEVVIGIEVHVQLKTKSKIFCSCSNQKNPEIAPNSTVCHICMGHPGTLPVLNEEVISSAVKAGLSINCDISPISFFDRKHYFYPDLPKGYQITQQYKPICLHGYVPIRLENGQTKKIRLSRIHIEEDAGKNVHAGQESFVDLNRAGTPLLEIVSLPDISSSFEARAYLKMLRSIVQTIDICTGNMEEGSFRGDTNISVRKKGADALGTKCELKNINSFKFISDAIEYEIERQIETLENGGKISQETRLWDTKEKVTKVMRTKEEAADYRYFPEPDLPPIFVSDEFKEKIKKELPELPYDKFERFLKEGLSEYEATIFLEDAELCHYFETARQFNKNKTLVNWILRELVSYIKETNSSYIDCIMTPKRLATIVNYIDEGKITAKIAQEIFENVIAENKDPEELIKTMDLPKQLLQKDLEVIVHDIIQENQTQVAEYKSGKTKLLGFFVGKAMEKTKGAANPATITQIVKKILE